MRPPREDTEPWYRQFWPWFLIALPATAVIASAVTITLAVTSRDGLVQDDYYKKGLAIYKDAAQAQTARQLGLKARLRYSVERPAVAIRLNDAAIGDLASLVLVAFHPTRSHQDRRLVLRRTAPNHYVGDLQQPLTPANWHISLEPPGGTWRLSGRIAIPQQSQAELE